MRRLCLALIASLSLAAPAAAGGCCGGYAAYEVQPSVPVATYRFDAPPPASQVYVVNQGPVVSGPGLYTYTNHYEPSFVPTAYPYVGGCGGYGGYGGCGHSYGYGCGSCGHTYSYGCGSCGRSYGYGYGYGVTRPYWPYIGGRRWYGGHAWRGYNGGYRGYRGYRHGPFATVAPARGY